MATTASTLLTARDVQACWSLLVEGIPLAATTWDSNSQMQTAYSGTGHAGVTWFLGLELIGNIGQRINLFDSKVDWEDVSFRVVDETADRLAALVCRESHNTAFKTSLTASFDNNDTTMNVLTTSAFPTTGTVYLGGNAYSYTGKTASSFTGCSPAYALFATNGGAAFTDYHAIPTDETGGLVEVWSAPRFVYNRRCALYLHHIEDGAPVTKANASLRWAGRVKEAPKDNGDGSFTFASWSVKQDLNQTLLDEQYTATLREGAWLLPAQCKVKVNSSKTAVAGGLTLRNTSETDIDFATSPATVLYRTHEDIRDGLNSTFNTWATALDIWPTRMRVALVDVDGEQRYQFAATLPDSSNRYTASVRLQPAAWRMLGWREERSPATKRLDYTSGSEMVLTAPFAPLSQVVPMWPGAAFTIDSETGVWADQPTMPPGLGVVDDPSNPATSLQANGFLQVTDQILAVHHKTSGSPRFAIVENVTEDLAPLGTSGVNVWNHLYTDGAALVARQVWIEHGVCGSMFLKLAASTGVAAYNAAVSDIYPRPLGLGIPYSLLDGPSWALMSRSTWWLILMKPTPFLDLLESALSMRNAHVVWSGGKLAIRRLGLVPPGAEDWSLTEANKAGATEGPDRTVVTRGGTGIINNAILHWNPDLQGKFRDTSQVSLASSIADFGKSKTAEIKGHGVYQGLLGFADAGLRDWAQSLAASLAHWARPVAIAKRSIDLSLADAVPGDSVTLSDNYAISPSTGTRGLSSWPGYITEIDFNWKDPKSSTATIALFPEADPFQLVGWSPSAQVASSSVAASKLTVTCTAHKYSQSTEAADASYFPAGYKCLIYEMSTAAGTTYALTVQSQSGNDITFTTDPTSGAALDTAKRWVVTFDDIATAVTAQKGRSFIVDSADTTTGDSTYNRYNWGGSVAPGDGTSTDYTTVCRRLVNQADNKGEPLAVHWFADAVLSANNLLGYKTRTHPVNCPMVSEQSQTGVTHKLVYGPVWVEWYGGSRRGAKVMARMKTSANTATARFICSTGMVRGTSNVTTTYPDGGIVYGDVTTTSTSYVYTSETTIATPWRTGARSTAAGGFWLTVELFNSTGGSVSYLDYVSLREVELE